MKTQKLLLLFLIFLQISCNSQEKKINGLSFVASSGAINQTHINPVQKAFANYVALMPFASIKNVEFPEIKFNSSRQWFGETEKGIAQYANLFKKNNIKIMLKPQLWVWRGEYTGYIEMRTEENWTILENSYSKFILFYAKLAQKIDVDIFCIGTELEKFVLKRPDYWQRLIIKIREIYSGKLTYAANWDEFKRTPFWASLDYIGVDAYFPLSEKENPTVQDFEEGWQPHKAEIIRIQQENNKPILFTEFGYRSINFTGKEPWKANRVSGNVNLEAQKNGLQAIYNQFWKEEWFAGGFVWKWFHKHNEVGGDNNNQFTLQNKPAEELLKELYAK